MADKIITFRYRKDDVIEVWYDGEMIIQTMYSLTNDEYREIFGRAGWSVIIEEEPIEGFEDDE